MVGAEPPEAMESKLSRSRVSDFFYPFSLFCYSLSSSLIKIFLVGPSYATVGGMVADARARSE